MLRRFSYEGCRFSQVLWQSVRRQAAFNALRDTLGVLVVGVWLIWGRGDLPASAVATTLLPAYRSGTVLSAAIGAQPHCLGALPGYATLWQMLAYAPQEAVPYVASLRNNLTPDQRQGRGVIESWLERLGLAHLLHPQGRAGRDAPSLD